MWIAWNINSKDITWPPNSIEEKVRIFYERALGWQLHIADLLANRGSCLGESELVKPLRHSGFAVAQICLSYFETIGHFEMGTTPLRKDRDYFKEGVQCVFPNLVKNYGADADKLLDRVYVGARCGLYHNSMTVVGVGLGQPDDGEPLAYDPNTNRLAISPERLPKALKLHLEQFRVRLLDPKNTGLRQNFEDRFNQDNGI